MFQTTRRRLAIWYATVTAVLLLLFASGVYWYFRTTLIDRVDDTLNHVAEVVAQSLVIEPTPDNPSGLRLNLEASLNQREQSLDDDRLDIEWFNTKGELLWSTWWEPPDIPLNPHCEKQTVDLGDGQLLRQITKPLVVHQQMLGYLRVSHPWFEVTKPTRKLIVDLSIASAVAIVSVGTIGWFLSGLAMKPVRESYQRLKQFTADASHEMRNPLATIQTNVQVALAEAEAEKSPIHQQLQVVERLTRRLGRLVDDLLFLARQDSGTGIFQWEEVALDALLLEIVEEQKAIAAERQISLSLDIREPEHLNIDPDCWFLVFGNQNQLARLFTNLIGNAVQYTPSHPQAQVTVEIDYGKNHASHTNAGNTSQSDQGWVQVTVSDNGIGIHPDALPHIFDRFYRVDPTRAQGVESGSGLGLSICAAIVANHHGDIHVNSEPQKGTTVRVALPAVTVMPEKS